MAKVKLFIEKKPSIQREQVRVTMLLDSIKGCEEMGYIHSKNFTAFQTKNNMINRMKKQAAKVGANVILLTDTKKEFGDVRDQAEGIVLYCESELIAKKP